MRPLPETLPLPLCPAFATPVAVWWCAMHGFYSGVAVACKHGFYSGVAVARMHGIHCRMLPAGFRGDAPNYCLSESNADPGREGQYQ